MKIGLFGGTFNPVHLGHLRAAEEVREKFNLSKIIFIPARIPPHKNQHITPSEDRSEMVKLSISGNPSFELSEIEIKRQGKSYSFETINYFKTLFKNRAQLYFIMGVDAFSEIHLWKQYPHFFSACHFIVMSRPGLNVCDHEHLMPPDVLADFKYRKSEELFIHSSGCCVYFNRVPPLDISSTEIRKKLEKGDSIKYLVHASVEQYIKEHCPVFLS